MALLEIDTLGSAIMKYVTIALIAGSIGFYKGCERGQDMTIENAIKSPAKSGYSLMYKIENEKMVPYIVDLSKANILPKGIEEKIGR